MLFPSVKRLHSKTIESRLRVRMYVAMERTGMVAARADRLKSSSLILHNDYPAYSASYFLSGQKKKGRLTVQKVKGRKKMLTKVSNLMFSPSFVDVRLSMTALALKS